MNHKTPFTFYTFQLSAYLGIGLALMTGCTSLESEANGELYPLTTTYPGTITNGDFLIVGNEFAPVVGDGVDEYTAWTFDFTQDPSYQSLDGTETLLSASLQLTLRTTNGGNITDSVRIEGFDPIVTDIIRTLPGNTTVTITLDLLEFYLPESLLQALTDYEGTMPMIYEDDAVVGHASLEFSLSTPHAQLFLDSHGGPFTHAAQP